MPLYEYRCTQCGNRFEKIQSFSAEPESVCPKCGGALERPLTAPALQFKGAGWYINDYAPKPAAGASNASSSESSGGEAKTESKSAESKPAESKPAESKPAATESKPASTSSTT